MFTALLSLSMIACALVSKSRPLDHDIPDLSSYDSSDVQDWQTMRDALLRNYRLLQCAGVKKAIFENQDDKASISLGMLNKSHLCRQFTSEEMAEISKIFMEQKYEALMDQLQAKCSAKPDEKDQAQCLMGLSLVATLCIQDKDKLIHELKRGGTIISNAKDMIEINQLK